MARTMIRFVMAATAALGCATALAQSSAPDYAADTLTGDWGGLRTDWHQRGVALDLGYKWDMLRVASGGLRRGGRPIGHFDLKAQFDMEKLANWAGGTVFVNFIDDNGGKLNRDHLGSLLGVSNIEVPVSTTRFFHAWAEQSFGDGQWALLAGLYPIDSEFQVIESAGLFVQPPYGPSPDLSLTRGPSIFNSPAFGLRAKWQSADQPGVYAMAAVLDGIPGDPARPKGTHVRFDSGDGAMQIAEIGYQAPAPAAEAPEVVGKYALGLWRYTAKVDDLVDVDANGVPELRSSSGWYALAERSLWRWGAGDLVGFVRYSATDGNSTAIKQATSVGMRARGLLPGREDDVFGLAYTRASIGDKFRTSQAAAGIAATAAEAATEITYRIQANKWLAVQPLIQHYRNPGVDGAVPRATVVGARVELAL